MKTILPIRAGIPACWLSAILLLLSSWSFSQTSPPPQTAPELSFTNVSLLSGTAGAVGAIYKFPNVGTNIDAHVLIKDRSSSLVKLENIDLTNTGYAKAFQPEVSYNNGSVSTASSWWMDFEITFVAKNTSVPATINQFKATALDIDGDGNRLREWVTMYGLNGYTTESNTQLTMTNLTQVIGGVTQTVGVTFTGVTTQYSGIDTAQTRLMATANYLNKNSFVYRAGSSTTGSASVTRRMFSVWFRDFSYNVPSITTLPAELISFEALLKDDQAELNWVTASEKNVSHFAVEKSLDGRNYSNAGMVFAVGNSSEKVQYQFKDRNLNSGQPGIIYYRLRVVDEDGRSELSVVRTVRIGKNNTRDISIHTYPNPVQSQVKVAIPESWKGKKVVLEIMDYQGVVFEKKLVSHAAGTESMDLGNLRQGHYLVRASCDGETAQQKLLKQ